MTGKKFLCVTTRELCYFSGSFFLSRINEAINHSIGESSLLYLSDGTSRGLKFGSSFSVLEKYEGEKFDGIIDINSKLPYLLAEDDTPFLDKIDAPFFNIILDHPLYHHPGLSFKLKNYNVITIDKAHKEYIEKYYPHIRSVRYLPLPGTIANLFIPLEERSNEYLFSGTNVSKDQITNEIKACGKTIEALSKCLIEEWDPTVSNMEDSLLKIDLDKFISSEEEEARSFPEWMNMLYAVDRFKRYEIRRKKLLSYASSLPSLSVMGEGWEETGLYDMKNVKKITPMPLAKAIEITADSKTVIDINPLFSYGVHDRVTTALVNGCSVITDGNPAALDEFKHKKNSWEEYVKEAFSYHSQLTG